MIALPPLPIGYEAGWAPQAVRVVARREIRALGGGEKTPSRSRTIAHIIIVIVLTGTVGLLLELTVTT